MTIARIQRIRHTICVAVDKFVAPIRRAIFIDIHCIIVTIARIQRIRHTISVAVNQRIAPIRRAIFIDIHRIIVPEACIVCILDPVFISVNKSITAIDDPVVIGIDSVVMPRAFIRRVKHPILVAVIDASVAICVPWESFHIRASINPRFDVIARRKGSANQTGVVGSVLSRLEHRVGFGVDLVAVRHWFALFHNALVRNGADVGPDNFTFQCHFVECTLGAVSDQRVAVGQSFCSRDKGCVHVSAHVPRP